MRFGSCLFIGLAFLSTNAVAQSAPQAVAKNLEISIYNNNLALVKDTREISFSKGINNFFIFRRLSAGIGTCLSGLFALGFIHSFSEF